MVLLLLRAQNFTFQPSSFRGSGQQDGYWTYELNASNEAIITGYSGLGGSVTIPNSLEGCKVTTIGEGALWGCNLTSLTIPDTVTNIEYRAIAYCQALTNVIILASAVTVGQDAFVGCSNLLSVTIAARSLGIRYIDPPPPPLYRNPVFGGCSQLTTITFSHGVSAIPSYFFAAISSLANVVLPESVTTIGANAFEGCNGLTSITIPESVTTIGANAFEGCNGLTNFSISSRLTASVVSIGLNQVLATDLMVKGIAERIIAAQPTNYGVATKSDLGTAVSNAISQTVSQVQSQPNSYNLFSADQYAANYNNGVVTGTSLVTAHPSSYNLYDSNSIMDLRMGGLMIQRQGTNAVVSFQPQTTTDLTQPFTNNGAPITHEVPMPGNKGFIRINAKPEQSVP